MPQKRSTNKAMAIAFALVALTALIALGCNQTPTPKPRGYFRLDLPEHDYDTLEVDCPFRFEKNVFTRWESRNNPCWGDLKYPPLNASLQFTYKPVNNNLDTLLKEAHELAYEHTVRASGIDENLIYDEQENVYGVMYRLTGNAASSVQFFVTDSSNHYLRAALYYYASPNADSLRPVNDYMEEEIEHMINTFRWKNSSR